MTNNTQLAQTVTFIGGGNMARAMVRGLVNKGGVDIDIRIADPSPDCRSQLEEAFPGLVIAANNHEAAAGAQLVVLAVKPQIIQSVAESLSGLDTAYLSIAAGTPLSKLTNALSSPTVMRAMPNQPAVLGLGVSALYVPNGISEAARSLAEQVLGACGLVIGVNSEREIDAATAISGSGPAYFYAVMDAMMTAAEQLGFSPDIARMLVSQTAAGAAAIAVTDPASLDELLARVTSPGGTTEAGRAVLAENHLHAIFERAIMAAFERGQTLATESDKQS